MAKLRERTEEAGLTVVFMMGTQAGNVEAVMCDGQVAVVVTRQVGRFSFAHSGSGTGDGPPCEDRHRV